MTSDPLILTAAFDPPSAAFFQRLRTDHFPASLNVVPAHLTLFHHLPGEQGASVTADLADVCAGAAAMLYASSGLRFLGRGVAYEIEAPDLVAMRKRLALSWQPWLTQQDRQGFRPHVTIQNKVGAAEARALFDRLAQAFEPISGLLVGLDLWHYRDGPWELVRRFSFGALS